MIDRSELIDYEKLVLERASQLFCNQSQKAIALRDRKDGILIVIADNDFPYRMETIFIKSSDSYFKHFINLLDNEKN